MGKLKIIGTIVLTIVVNTGFIYISYLTYGKFKLSFLHMVCGLLPLILFIQSKNKKV